MAKIIIDYSHVEDRHSEIHDRLELWAKWVNPQQQVWMTQPMFRQYRSHAWQWETPQLKVQINTIEAHQTEKAVSFLPEKHRAAIRWCYVWRTNPIGIARELGQTKEGLADLIEKGRDILKNRLAKHEIMC